MVALKMSRRNSQLWLHFSEEDSERKVKCLYCNVRLSVANRSTCSLIRHLERKHKIQFEHKASLKKSKNTSLVPVLKKETVSLYDKEKDMLVEVILSPEDACRAAKDTHFAGELVKLALQNSRTDGGGADRMELVSPTEAGVVDPSVQLLEISEETGGGEQSDGVVGINGSGRPSLHQQSSPAAPSHPPPPAAASHHLPSPPAVLGEDGSLYMSYSESADKIHTDEIPDGKGYKWSSPSVMLLLQEYRRHWQELSSGQLTNGGLCQLLSDRLKTAGYPSVAPSLVAIKLRALKKTYLSIKQYNINATGTDRRSWPFFEIMDAIHTNKRWCNPEVVEPLPPPPVPATATRSLPAVTGGGTTPPGGSSDSETPLDSESSSITALLRKILRQREEHEANKRKRHRERLEMDRKMLELLNKLVSK